MRRTFVLLLPILLSGCVRDWATYEGSATGDSVTVRAEQDYFWDKRLKLKLSMARLPDCQRVLDLADQVPGVNMQLFSTGERVYTLRSAEQSWTFETQNCAMLEASAAPGTLLGTYSLEGSEVVFTPAAAPQ